MKSTIAFLLMILMIFSLTMTLTVFPAHAASTAKQLDNLV